MLKFGYAEVDISPHSPIETIGFNRGDNISQGILKPLMAQVTVWNDEDTSCLITIGSIGFNFLTAILHRMRMRYQNIMKWYAKKSKQQ